MMLSKDQIDSQIKELEIDLGGLKSTLRTTIKATPKDLIGRKELEAKIKNRQKQIDDLRRQLKAINRKENQAKQLEEQKNRMAKKNRRAKGNA